MTLYRLPSGKGTFDTATGIECSSGGRSAREEAEDLAAIRSFMAELPRLGDLVPITERERQLEARAAELEQQNASLMRLNEEKSAKVTELENALRIVGADLFKAEKEVERLKVAHSDSVAELQRTIDACLSDFMDVREALGLKREYQGGESALDAAKRIVAELAAATKQAGIECAAKHETLARGRREGWERAMLAAVEWTGEGNATVSRDGKLVGRSIGVYSVPFPSDWAASSAPEAVPLALTDIIRQARSWTERCPRSTMEGATEPVRIVRDLASFTTEVVETPAPEAAQKPRCDTCEREADLLGESCSTGERTWAFCALCLANQRDAAESAAQRAKFADAEAERWAKRVIELEADRTKIRWILDRLR